MNVKLKRLTLYPYRQDRGGLILSKGYPGVLPGFFNLKFIIKCKNYIQ